MKLRLLLSISLCALALQTVCGESADDYFHSGAQSYLSNNVAGARQQVDKGLKLFPDDTKLKKLDELLKQQQQQQNQQQQNQQQNQSQQQKQQQSQSKQDQQKSEQQKQEEEQKRQQEQAQKNQQGKQGDERKQKEEQQTPPGQMSPEEAKRLLDAQKNDESLLPANHQDQHRDHPLKDW